MNEIITNKEISKRFAIKYFINSWDTGYFGFRKKENKIMTLTNGGVVPAFVEAPPLTTKKNAINIYKKELFQYIQHQFNQNAKPPNCLIWREYPAAYKLVNLAGCPQENATGYYIYSRLLVTYIDIEETI